MDIEAFERLAGRMWDEIPEAFRAGIEGVVVEPGAPEHPDIPGIFTLGECTTEQWPDGAGGEGETRSRILLHHGSFRALARRDSRFDWHEEMWETLLHELLHHREAAAREDGLELYDWAADQNFARHADMRFDPAFYRALPADVDGAVRVEGEIFVEAHVAPAARSARFRWRGEEYDVRIPANDGPLYVNPRNLAGGRLWVVVWRRSPRAWRRLLEWAGFGGRRRRAGRHPMAVVDGGTPAGEPDAGPGSLPVPHLRRRARPVPADLGTRDPC